MILTSFGLGIFLGFIFFELTGLTAGGIIVPGYIALYIHQPMRILITVVLSLLTYLIIIFLSRYMVLYGRRRFLTAILLGFLMRAAFDWLRIYLPENTLDLQAIGYIIPGLIANEFFRQGVPKTIAGMTIVSITVFFILMLFYS
ncbi:MAG: poly-gamma-glutamate biosynthesis protein PgsC [Calditrichaeota bacterium]|nr:poly-gamma-glutamate biosynthesis protein PgsC [Calditrichota bacterium]RQW06607.1 MAG: poly-gamma-glutamate biosynthesis protein PgsC [Calditrichota bacterium]